MSPRRKTDKHLPPRMYRKGRAYYYVDRFNKWHNLGRDYAPAMARYGQLTKPTLHSTRLSDIIDRYLALEAPLKADSTRQAVTYSARFLRAGLGNLDARTITQQTVYAYMDHRLHSRKNATTPIQVNKEIRHLSMILSRARRWGTITDNPVIGIELCEEPKRHRYVTDAELQAFRDFATPLIQDYLDMKLLTALRRMDILGLRLQDLQEDGIHVQPAKTAKSTGKRLIIEWSPKLRQVVERIRARPRPKVQRIDRWLHLFCTRNGTPYTADGFSAIWQRQKRKALDKGIVGENFIDTDLRAKAATDTDLAHARQLLGHADERTTRAHYRRKPEKVRPLK